jgi:WD40 repeat protein
VDIWTVAFSPDDKFIISGSHSGKIALYGVESAKQEQTLDTRGKFTLSIAYVSDILALFHLCHITQFCSLISYSFIQKVKLSKTHKTDHSSATSER